MYVSVITLSLRRNRNTLVVNVLGATALLVGTVAPAALLRFVVVRVLVVVKTSLVAGSLLGLPTLAKSPPLVLTPRLLSLLVVQTSPVTLLVTVANIAAAIVPLNRPHVRSLEIIRP